MIIISNKTPISFVIANKEVQKIKINNDIVWQKVQPEYLYVENKYNGTNTISIKQTLAGSPDSTAYAKHLQYSKDGLNWTTFSLSSTAFTISLLKGEKVYFRGNEGVFNYWASGGAYKAITNITANQTHNIGGDINTLLNYNNTQGLTLPQGAFNSIFENNTKLTSASDLTLQQSTDGSLPSFCYLYMFNGCSSLTTAPQSIPATIQGQAACQCMFQDCTHLTTAPELPATTLANYCYNAIFQGCSALTTAPELPATIIGQYSYRYAFRDCTSLTTAPELPATTLANYCYQSMFQGCSALTTAPELPAKTLVDYCYQQMFRNCTHLNKVTIYADNNSASNCINNWLYGVAATGTFINQGSATYPTNSTSGIPIGWNQVDYNEYFYVENTYNGTNSIAVDTVENFIGETPTSGFATSLQFSKDKINWTTIQLIPENWETITLNKGEKVYFRNNSGYFNYTDREFDKYHRTAFMSSKSHIVGGNVMSLIDYENMSSAALPTGAFCSLFSSDQGLTNASLLLLPDKTSENCFKFMFSGCTGLTSAPKLPATTMSYYCYSYMFEECTALTASPALPSIELAEYCYTRMFDGCHSLTAAPALPAEELKHGCYSIMFRGCTSLATAPALPAETLVASCYTSMFENCTSLTSITVGADDISATLAITKWLKNTGNGTFHNLGTATYSRDENTGVPNYWTITT